MDCRRLKSGDRLIRRQFLASVGAGAFCLNPSGCARQTALPFESDPEEPHMGCGNTPYGGPTTSLPDPGTPKAGFDVKKTWKNGSRLLVRFVNSERNDWIERLRSRIQVYVKTWSDYANLAFEFTDDPAARPQMTVNLLPYKEGTGMRDYGTYNSQIGKDSLDHLDSPASMNLLLPPRFAKKTDQKWVEAECRRVILHEWGHAIALIHEHQRPDAKLVWNEPAVREFAKPWHWKKTATADPVMDNFIKAYSPDRRIEGSALDDKSIMIYAIPPGLATDVHQKPFTTAVNFELSPLDKVTAASIYPSQVVSPPLVELERKDQPDSEGMTLAKPGQVGLFSVAGKPGEKLIVEIGGPMPSLVSWLRNRRRFVDAALPGNILAASENPGGDGIVALPITVPAKDRDYDREIGLYFIEVRHQKPTSGLGTFTLRVRTSV